MQTEHKKLHQNKIKTTGKHCFNRKQKADMAATCRCEAEITGMKRTRHGLEKMRNAPLRKKQRDRWNTWSKTDERNKKHLS